MEGIHYERILHLAGGLGVPVVCSSDAHSTRDVGKWYVEFASPVDSEEELARRLNEGTFTIGHPAPVAGV